MKALFTALYNRYISTTGVPPADVHNALYIALGATATVPRFYMGKAPQGILPPYVVFSIVSGVPNDTFTEDLQDRVLQFSLFDSGSSAGTICDNYALLRTLFDDCALSVTGYKHLFMQWESEQGPVPDLADPAVWQLDCEYRIMTEKN